MINGIKYYLIRYKFHGNISYAIWFSDEENDYLSLDDSGKLIKANSISDIRKKGKKFQNINKDENYFFDLDKFWISIENLRVNKASSEKTCKVLLDGWNFIEDLLRTFKLENEMNILKSRVMTKIYEKIFSGNNLPSITPDGKSYSPLWTKLEIQKLRKNMKSILEFLSEQNYI